MSANGTAPHVSRAGLVLIAALLLIAMLMVLALGGGAAALGGGAAALGGTGSKGLSAEPVQAEASALAQGEIPSTYLRLYLAAAQRYGIDWSILAGIGRVECDHGRDRSPSCTQEGSQNAAGAAGPMQFLASTWQRYGVDGDGDGRADRWDPADAIFSAANYLRAAGAPGNYSKAIYAYNHAWWYVDEVKAWAARYRGTGGLSQERGSDAGVGETSGAMSSAGAIAAQAGRAERAISQQSTSTPVLYIAGDQARLLRGDGHVALIPEVAPAAVQAMIVAGNELQQMRYGPSGHPDPLGADSEDCSSAVNYVLYRAGLRPLSEIVQRNPLAQDYVNWGAPGPGRWVSIYATDLPTPHVFIVIAGLRLDTVGGGTDEGPNRLQGGPRWRLLPYIPTWAHWSVRHPPGL